MGQVQIRQAPIEGVYDNVMVGHRLDDSEDKEFARVVQGAFEIERKRKKGANPVFVPGMSRIYSPLGGLKLYSGASLVPCSLS